jgi:hypothetical protein
MVFTTNDFEMAWDGTFKNVQQEIDVYSYVINWLNPSTNKSENVKGNIHLIR